MDRFLTFLQLCFWTLDCFRCWGVESYQTQNQTHCQNFEKIFCFASPKCFNCFVQYRHFLDVGFCRTYVLLTFADFSTRTASLQAQRALMVIAVILSFIGLVIGMASLRCTTMLDNATKWKSIIGITSGTCFLLTGQRNTSALRWRATLWSGSGWKILVLALNTRSNEDILRVKQLISSCRKRPYS